MPQKPSQTNGGGTAIAGAAIGAALMGMRPVAEMQFADFISCCFDQLVNFAATNHYRWGGSVPIVIRAPSGGGLRAGPFHSQNPEAWFVHVPGLKVVALCMSDKGMPRTTEERLAIADELINVLAKNNIPMGNIYVDPLVQPISTNATFGVSFLDAIEAITTRFDGVHTVCGLSNISYGLPARKMLNRVFAVMAIIRGLDALIVNPLDAPMAAEIVAAQALAGKDEFCMNYLKAFRSGLLQAN